MVLTWARHGSNALLLVLIIVFVAIFALGVEPFAWWAVPIGIAVFGIFEYTTHRFTFHAKPSGNATVRWFQSRMHYDHHKVPEQLDLLFLPWWFVVPVSALYFAVFMLVTRSLALSCALFLGVAIGTAYYEWVHYIAHIPYQPRSVWARWMKKYHLWHHFKSERHWFGVTSPAMDFVGVSYARVEDVERSGSTRDLYGA